jgi:outer membrane protein insertion porin family
VSLHPSRPQPNGRPSARHKTLGMLTRAALAAVLLSASFARAQTSAPASRPSATVVFPGRDTDVLEGRPILRVEVAGNSRTPSEAILAVTRVQGGQLYARNQVEVDVRNLAALEKFSAVKGDVVPTADGKVVILYTVEERATINAVEIAGNRNLANDVLRELLITRAGATYDPFSIEQDRQALVNAYKKEGYSTVIVDVDKKTWDKQQILRFVITEGPKVRIESVVFQGNEHLTDDFLKWKIQTKPYFWIFQKGLLEDDTLDNDVNIIKDQYRRRGYIDVQVSRSLDFSADKSRVTVRFVIIEGQRYRVGKINITGNKVFPVEGILGDLAVHAGDYLDHDQIERSQRHIEDRYGRLGYINHKVEITTAFTQQQGVVDLNFNINENDWYTVGQIIIRGNTNIQDRVPRRQIRIYPDQTYDTTLVSKSVDRLKAQGLYKDVRITPIITGPRTADVLVEIQEGQTGKVSLGAGLSSNSGLIGNLSLEQKNFDIANFPNSFDEFIHGKSFTGQGQYFQLSLEPGTQLQRYRIRLEEPSLFDSPYSASNDLFLFTRQRESYDEQRIGDIITFGRRFGDVWAVALAFRAEQVQIKNPQDTNNDGVSEKDYFLVSKSGNVYGGFTDSAQQILDQKGSHFITTIKPAIIRDTTDSRIFPTEGSRASLSWEQYGVIGGDLTMSKIVARYDWYYTLYQDLFDRKTVFVQRNEVGAILGSSQFYERFYGGGIGGLRGFRFRGVSPRQGGLNDPVGGDFEWFSSGEVNFPIYEEMLRGVVFVDIGTVEQDITINSIRSDVGAGVRVVIPFFGKLPLALDVAFPVTKASGDRTQVLSFSLGIPY